MSMRSPTCREQEASDITWKNGREVPMFMFRKGVAPAMPGHVQNLSRIWEELLPLAVKKIRYKKESYFSFPDTEANTFGYIKSGHTGTIHPLFDGQEHIKFLISEGCLFRESYIIAGFCNSFPLHRCLTDVEIYQFNGDMLVDPAFAAAHPEHIRNVMWAMAVKQSSLDMIADIVAQKTVAGKIANYLHICSKVQGNSRFAPNITQLELSLMLNIHKSSLNRTLLNMQSMGIIDGFTKKKCTVLASKKLKAVADGVLVL